MSNDTKSLVAATATKTEPKESSGSSEVNDSVTGPLELTAMVENLLNELQDKFAEHSKKILGKLNDMSSRIDELEKSLEKVLAHEDSAESGKS